VSGAYAPRPGKRGGLPFPIVPPSACLAKYAGERGPSLVAGYGNTRKGLEEWRRAIVGGDHGPSPLVAAKFVQ